METNYINVLDLILNDKIDEFIRFENELESDKFLYNDFINYINSIVKHMNYNGLDFMLNKILYKIYKNFYLTIKDSKDMKKLSPLLYKIQYSIEEKLFKEELKEINFPESIFLNDNKQFIQEMKKTIEKHYSNNEEFYMNYLPNFSTINDLKYFFIQESELDGRFDDLLASTQIGVENNIKLEFAKNYWDEMGQGNYQEMHTVLFNHILEELQISDNNFEKLNIETIKSSNISTYLSLNRNKFYYSIGYLGTIEYAGPKRFKKIITAFKRLNLSKKSHAYHILHEKIDLIHGNDWMTKVIKPLVENVQHAKEIYAGMMIRLNTSTKYLELIKQELIKKENKYE
jgi:hypothetical protein